MIIQIKYANCDLFQLLNFVLGANLSFKDINEFSTVNYDKNVLIRCIAIKYKIINKNKIFND